jgi:hypothetical protein
VTDAFGNVTTIERDVNGRATAIEAPFGQRTLLGNLTPSGYFTSIENPTGEQVSFTYQDGTVATLSVTPDPRFGMDRPLAQSLARFRS